MPKTYDKQTGTFLGKVAECMPELPASVMQGWMENPACLARVLKNLHPWHDQEVWHFSCALTSGKEARRKSEVFDSERNICLGIWGKKLFDAAFPVVPAYDRQCATVRLKLHQLGITEPTMLRDFKKRAQQFGLVECPLFVAYHYRLRYEKQPLNEYLYILTKSVDIGDGELSLFGLKHLTFEDRQNPNNPRKSRLWLDGHYGQDDFKWNPDSEWVFALKE